MLRRTFLKSVGAVAVAISVPETLAKEKQQVSKFYKWAEPTWINFTEEMPKVGQKIAVFTYFGKNSEKMEVATGVVLDKKDFAQGKYYEEDILCIELGFNYSPDAFFGRDPGGLLFNLLWPHGKEYMQKINRATWINEEEVYSKWGDQMIVPRHGRKKTGYIGINESYWYPIDEYIPKDLPSFPAPKPVKIITENGKRMLVK